MAQQLVESMCKEQELIEYNMRLEERARIEQEMQTARLIQHSLVPKEVPHLVGWRRIISQRVRWAGICTIF